MKLMTLLALFFVFTAQSKECDLSKGLSKSQIKVLKKAQKLKRVEFPGWDQDKLALSRHALLPSLVQSRNPRKFSSETE